MTATAQTPLSPVARGLAVASRAGAIEVDGCAIAYRMWGEPSAKAPVLLVHGFLAQSRWWDPVAGWLSQDREVVAFDFSGMGDSGRRESYDRLQHAREIEALARSMGRADTILIAHSYGGDPAIRACRNAPDLFGRLVLLDCRLVLPGVVRFASNKPLRKAIYQTAAEARARFRLTPESHHADPELHTYIARHSVVREAAGWSWKFDSKVAHESAFVPLDPRDLALRVAFIRGGDSDITTPEQMAVTRRYLPRARFLELPAAGHHLQIDQPLALVAMLRGLIEEAQETGEADA